MRIVRSILAVALGLGLFACDDHDHDHEHEEGDVTAEACEHAADGPFQAVDAAEADSAPAIQSYTHTRIDITLAAGADGNGGSVVFNAEAEGDYIFFLTADVPLAFSAGGASLDVEATADVTECAEVAISYTIELPAGEALLTFGPTEESQIGVIFEAAGEHDHDH